MEGGVKRGPGEPVEAESRETRKRVRVDYNEEKMSGLNQKKPDDDKSTDDEVQEVRRVLKYRY